MDKERRNEILSKLNNPETTQADKTELLDELRNATNAMYHQQTEYEKQVNELKSNNDDLTQANGKLFLKLNTIEDTQEEQEKGKPVKPLSELLAGKEIKY